MASTDKIRDPSQVDRIISAEIPDATINPRLHRIITTFNLHGPCGKLRPQASCNVKGKDGDACSKNFPRAFNNEGTNINPKMHYPQYLRRDELHGGRTFKKFVNGKEVVLDNRWVVPYSPVLSEIFEAHINVEVVMSLGAVKYLYKYVTKGSDKIMYSLQNKDIVDEVEMFEVGRFVSATEAFWRIYQFKINFKHPNVKKMPIHLPKQQLVYFDPDKIDEASNKDEPKTELMAFFELNERDESAQNILYPDIPKYYTWQAQKKCWERRKVNLTNRENDWLSDTIGRIPIINLNPKQEELYFMRICLHHIPGPKSFEDLRTVNGNVCESYKEACLALGLLADDKELSKALETAETVTFGRDLRELFGTMLTHCNPSDAAGLWQKHKLMFVQDYIRQNGQIRDPEPKDYNRALREIQSCLNTFGLDLNLNYGINYDPNMDDGTNNIIEEAEIYETIFLNTITTENKELFTAEQSEAFNLITKSIAENEGKCFALDAPGGNGKTFLITTLLASIRAKKEIAIATATSCIAATLLQKGRTLHSTMKVPLDIDETSTCGITPRDKFAADLRRGKLLVIDEVTMAHKHIYESVDSCLRDITGKNKLFGGITVLLSGDWRQILPVVHRGGRADIVDACLKKSYIWSQVKQIKLTKNMRLRNENDENIQFAEYLLKIGNGQAENVENSKTDLRIPPSFCLKDNSMEELCDFVYSEERWDDSQWVCSRAVLAPTNDLAEKINYFMLAKIPGVAVSFKSADTILDGYGDLGQYPPEFINSLTMPGLPAHDLHLKPGCPIMLLRNLDPVNGHCNGTRYIINQIHQHLIDATIAFGPYIGKRKLIPRISMTSKDTIFPFSLKRMQFPVRPSFAMTVNKSQGQSFDRLGVFLDCDIFCHGQLYVALSRVRDVQSLKIATIPQREGLMKNIVYPEIL